MTREEIVEEYGYETADNIEYLENQANKLKHDITSPLNFADDMERWLQDTKDINELNNGCLEINANEYLYLIELLENDIDNIEDKRLLSQNQKEVRVSDNLLIIEKLKRKLQNGTI